MKKDKKNEKQRESPDKHNDQLSPIKIFLKIIEYMLFL